MISLNKTDTPHILSVFLHYKHFVILCVFPSHSACVSSSFYVYIFTFTPMSPQCFFTIQRVFLHYSTCISSQFNVYFVTVLSAFFQQPTCTSAEFQLYFFTVLHAFLYYSTVFQYHPMCIPSPFYVLLFYRYSSPFYAIWGPFNSTGISSPCYQHFVTILCVLVALI